MKIKNLCYAVEGVDLVGKSTFIENVACEVAKYNKELGYRRTSGHIHCFSPQDFKDPYFFRSDFKNREQQFDYWDKNWARILREIINGTEHVAKRRENFLLRKRKLTHEIAKEYFASLRVHLFDRSYVSNYIYNTNVCMSRKKTSFWKRIFLNAKPQNITVLENTAILNRLKNENPLRKVIFIMMPDEKTMIRRMNIRKKEKGLDEYEKVGLDVYMERQVRYLAVLKYLESEGVINELQVIGTVEDHQEGLKSRVKALAHELMTVGLNPEEWSQEIIDKINSVPEPKTRRSRKES